ncbi:unnamed protein product [Rhizoctonia solani]|uniref:Uncharacterized protein n=1 Tax=Rhizoctonia solani TaxID=456999 RepID=A0A8H3DSV4_9AGAM|nr:unnamed protein product [Rhizoctonia solani]
MVDVHLALILKICQQIQAHRLARVYTLQRYNCYFFAQTLIMCIACGASNWVGTVDRLSQQHNYDSSSSRQGLPTLNYSDSIFGLETPINRNTDYPEAYGNPFGTRATRSRYDFHPGAYHSQEGYNYWESYDFIHITRSITVPQHSKLYNGLMFASLDSVTHLMVIKTNRGTLPTGDQETILNLESIPRAGRARRSIFRWRKGKKIQQQEQETMTASTIEGMRNYIGDLISDHSTRVEEYRWATKAGAFEVYDDISEAIDEIWKSLVQ